MNIVPVVRARWDYALDLFFQAESPGERRQRKASMLHSVKQGELTLDRFWLAESERGTHGVMLCVMQEDGIGFLWPPVTRDWLMPVQVVETEDALIQHVLGEITRDGGWLAQALLEPEDEHTPPVLERNGFTLIAHLTFLQRALSLPLPARRPPNWEITPFEPENLLSRERFANVIERTYRESMDCPFLSGTRTGLQAVQSHALTGTLIPHAWCLFSEAGQDLAVLVLADHPREDAWEVVYLGVVPEARGRGLGREILIHGLNQARKAGRSSVFLAVDHRNHAAIRIYENLSFASASERVVYGRLLNQP